MSTRGQCENAAELWRANARVQLAPATSAACLFDVETDEHLLPNINAATGAKTSSVCVHDYALARINLAHDAVTIRVQLFRSKHCARHCKKKNECGIENIRTRLRARASPEPSNTANATINVTHAKPSHKLIAIASPDVDAANAMPSIPVVSNSRARSGKRIDARITTVILVLHECCRVGGLEGSNSLVYAGSVRTEAVYSRKRIEPYYRIATWYPRLRTVDTLRTH
jgi:hypothetical protein